jgi:pyruvate,orthophosphate dikinase
MKEACLARGGARSPEGDVITIDGASGEVILGAVPTVQPELSGDFGTLMVWADAARRMKVRANAETPRLTHRSRATSALKGIGLCRTEHMFFDAARITARAPDDPSPTDEAGRRARRWPSCCPNSAAILPAFSR